MLITHTTRALFLLINVAIIPKHLSYYEVLFKLYNLKFKTGDLLETARQVPLEAICMKRALVYLFQQQNASAKQANLNSWSARSVELETSRLGSSLRAKTELFFGRRRKVAHLQTARKVSSKSLLRQRFYQKEFKPFTTTI